MKHVTFVLLAVLLGGCAITPPAHEAPAVEAVGSPIVVEPGKPFVLKSRELTGNLALDILYHPAPGECTITAMFAAVDHPDGPQFYSRGVDVDGNPTGGWGSVVGVGAGAMAAGTGTRDAVDKEEIDGGFGGTFNVSTGARDQFWANSLQYHENPTTLDSAVYIQITCTTPTQLTIRAAREAFLAAPGDFEALASAGGSLAGDGILYGSLAHDFSSPAEWWFMPNLGSFELTVETPAWERQWTQPDPENMEPLPVGGSWFRLTAAGARSQFVVAAAAFEPVSSMDDIEALPSWISG